MKKAISLLMIISIAVLVSVGCSSNNKTANDKEPIANALATTAPEALDTGTNATEQSVFGQDVPKPDVYGQVDMLSGSILTIKVIAYPDKAKVNPQSTTKPDAKKEKQYKFTGEIKTVVIAKTATITSFLKTDTGKEMKTIKQSEISKGDIVGIWCSDPKKTITSKIIVLKKPLPVNSPIKSK